jgi:hypothetical protein
MHTYHLITPSEGDLPASALMAITICALGANAKDCLDSDVFNKSPLDEFALRHRFVSD